MKILLSLAGFISVIILGAYYNGLGNDAPPTPGKQTVIKRNNDTSRVLSTSTKTVTKQQKQGMIVSKVETKVSKERNIANSKKEQVLINSKINELEQNLQDDKIKNDLIDELKNATNYRENILGKAKQEMNIN